MMPFKKIVLTMANLSQVTKYHLKLSANTCKSLTPTLNLTIFTLKW